MKHLEHVFTGLGIGLTIVVAITLMCYTHGMDLLGLGM